MSAIDQKFLIIGCDLELRHRIRSCLEARGHRQIYEADRVRDALDVLNSETVDCIISEWDLPIANGFSLLKLLRGQERFKDLIYILMSEVDAQHQEKIVRAANQKVDGFLLKPFDLQTLEKLLDTTQGLN